MLIDLRMYCRENKGFLIFSSFIALILHLFSVGLSLIEVIWKKCCSKCSLAGKSIAVEIK